MKALVTGAAGFAGRHLVRYLRDRGDDVVAAGHDAEEVIDFRLPEDVTALVHGARPDVIFHLAGTSSVAEMMRDPAGGNANIVQPAIHVMEAVAFGAVPTRVVLVSSCLVYGRASRLPMDETLPLQPADLYAAARAAVDYMAANYLARGVDVVIARAFHHTGPGQDRRFAVGEWVARANEARIPVGDLELRRDYSDVRDIVAGYALVAERGARGEVYNLCSGEARAMRELFALAAPDSEPVLDPARVRKNEVRITLGTAAKAEALGWKRRWRIEDTISAMRGG